MCQAYRFYGSLCGHSFRFPHLCEQARSKLAMGGVHYPCQGWLSRPIEPKSPPSRINSRFCTICHEGLYKNLTQIVKADPELKACYEGFE